MKTIDLTKENNMPPPLGLHYETLSGAKGCMTRALWEQVFTEDTPSFLDYYYREKTTGAHIHVLRADNGQVVSMVHANPYGVMIHGARRGAYYIVGVATAQSYRHRGCMAFLLQKAVFRAKREGCPFVFLMPANAAIYEPFGFRYGGKLTMWERRACLKEGMMRGLPPASDPSAGHLSAACSDMAHVIRKNAADELWVSFYSSADTGVLAEYAQNTLAERYDTYCVHDEAYFERLSRELASENGGIYLLWRWRKPETGEQTEAGKQTEAGEQTEAGKQTEAGEQTEAGKQTETGEQPETGEHPWAGKQAARMARSEKTLCGYFCFAYEEEEYLQEVIVDREAEELFLEKSREKRIMFLSLEENCRYGRTYFPEIV